jgi:amino-acid N-acetyltransferase
VTPVPALDLSPRLRDAVADDVPAIVDLIQRFAAAGKMLPRTPRDVLRALPRFVVMDSAGCVVACGGLRVYSRELAEVVSLAVDEDWQGRGIGAVIVDHLLERAETMGIARIFAMTLREPFFHRQGFQTVPRAWIPEKEAADCRSCARCSGCREIAVWRDLAVRPAMSGWTAASPRPGHVVVASSSRYGPPRHSSRPSRA